MNVARRGTVHRLCQQRGEHLSQILGLRVGHREKRWDENLGCRGLNLLRQHAPVREALLNLLRRPFECLF